MDEKDNEVIKSLNEMVDIFKRRNTVSKIYQVKDVRTAYEEEKVAIREQLERFKEEMLIHFMKGTEYPASEVSEVISIDNVVEICFILLMSEVVDDYDLVEDYESIGKILKDVPEDLQYIADRFYKFLYEEEKCFSEYSEEELLKELLL